MTLTTSRCVLACRSALTKVLRRRLATTLACSIPAGCGDSATVVGPGAVFRPSVSDIVIVSGDGQSATVGTPLPSDLVVRVTDVLGSPLPGVPVQWTFNAGGGRSNPTGNPAADVVVSSDSLGFASIQWILGTRAGPQEAWVSLVDSQDADDSASLTEGPAGAPKNGRGKPFRSDAKAGVTASVVVSPGSANVIAGDTVRLTALSYDTYGNRKENVVHSWQSSSSAVARVDSSGLVTGVSGGEATVYATQASVTGSAQVTVSAGSTTTAPITIASTQPPRGAVGTSYSHTLSATGGTGVFSWSIPSGSLPSGLVLDPTSGSITGTPLAAGTSTFTVQAASGGQTATSSKSIVVDPQPVSAGAFRRNRPSGWVTVTDYGFDDALLPHQDGVLRVSTLGTSGWEATDWGLVGGPVRRITDPTAPFSPAYVLEEVYPAHLSGQGPDKVAFHSIPNVSKLYISWVVKWQDGFHHNSTSEKMIFFNLGGGGYDALFQFEYGVEMIHGIPEAGGYPALRANQMPPNSFGHGNAPPVNGVWMEYEILIDKTTGTVKWWKDGVLHGYHTGRSLPSITNVEIAATWGGGGDKIGVSSRYQDHIFIAVAP